MKEQVRVSKEQVQKFVHLIPNYAIGEFAQDASREGRRRT